MRKAIKLNSYWGVTTRNIHNDSKSDVLVVLLPGMDYRNDKPLLRYTEKIALEEGCDTLSIEYGFQVANKKLDKDNETVVVIKESRRVFNKAMENNYKKVLFVGKSIGTIIQNYIQKNEEKNYESFNIYLTPTDESVEMGLKKGSLVFTGSKDKYIMVENRRFIKSSSNFKVIEFEGANHSLEIDNETLKNIDRLKIIMEMEKNFITKLKKN